MRQLSTGNYRSTFAHGFIPIFGVAFVLTWFAYSAQYWAAAASFLCSALFYWATSTRLGRSGGNMADSSLEEVWAHLAKVQVRRRHTLTAFGVLVACLLPFVASTWTDGSPVQRGVQWVGLALILTALLGRSWCMLYLGGRKGSDLIAQGPYSVSRNPLYLFSMTAVVGIGAQSGSITLGLFLALFIYMVFNSVIGEEERLLRKVFGTQFDDYCAKVPRFGPKYSNWVSPDEVLVSISGLWNTVRDALPYFLAVPLFAFIQYAQATGWIPVLIRLP